MPQAPRIAFRVDAAREIGTGHVTRCLALGQALRRLGAQLRFVCRARDVALVMIPADELLVLPATIAPAVQAGPPHAQWLGADPVRDAADTLAALAGWAPDWIVVDHYALDALWHRAVRGAGARIAVVDDLADRNLDADLVIDHNAHADHAAKYAGRLKDRTRILGGPRYALLGQVYAQAPRYRFRDGVRSIGVFMGGTDAPNVSATALDAINAAGFFGPVEVVSTTANANLPALKARGAARPDTTLTLDQPSLAPFFAAHDLQIGAGGGATWERMCIGAPTIAVVAAENQRAALTDETRDAQMVVSEASAAAIAAAIAALIADPARRRAMSDAARVLVDGRGAMRVAGAMLAPWVTVRPATADDSADALAWRNHPATRAVSLNSAEIAPADHQRWFAGVLADPARHLLVGTLGPARLGFVRYDQIAPGHYEISIYADPALAGSGLGTAMLAPAERWLAARKAGSFTIEATVVGGNVVSARMFERNGYSGGGGQYRRRVSGTAARHGESRA